METHHSGHDSQSQRGKSESVKVCLRIRPMNDLEVRRGDEECIKMLTPNTCEIQTKSLTK